ncbi:MAG TPA: hypothetical protein VGK19_01620 [Capsulimonadaceae bacterium]|jgi:Spy/CpxP family protein refolding chaperone
MKTKPTLLFAALCASYAFSAPAFSDEPPPRGDRPPRADRPAREPGQRRENKYTLEQAISDRAQLTTIAFSGLAFLTGSFTSDTFLPPGKVSDYFGFQYMRDVQDKGMGHNTDFLTRIANNMILVLTDAQRAQLVALGNSQGSYLTWLAYQRYPVIQAFCRQSSGEIPKGSAGLDKAAVTKAVSDIFALDGELAYQRAVVCGGILNSLTAEQRAALAKLKFGDYTTWPEMEEPLDKRTMSHGTHVLVMTYASEMFSWYAGNVEADTYFCPERHGTYFGGFYMKDAPAMGHHGYTISTSLTGDSGEQFLATLTPVQRERITSIVDLQRADLSEIVTIRRAISTELRKCMTGAVADKAKVIALSKRYGALDGELSWLYATRFAEVAKSLTTDQKAALVKLRGTEVAPQGVFVYSDLIATPAIGNTDYLFGTSGLVFR